MSERITVTRVLVYEGPRAWVETTLRQSHIRPGAPFLICGASITETARSPQGRADHA